MVLIDFINIMLIARSAPFYARPEAALNPVVVAAYGRRWGRRRRAGCAPDCSSKNENNFRPKWVFLENAT